MNAFTPHRSLQVRELISWADERPASPREHIACLAIIGGFALVPFIGLWLTHVVPDGFAAVLGLFS